MPKKKGSKTVKTKVEYKCMRGRFLYDFDAGTLVILEEEKVEEKKQVE